MLESPYITLGFASTVSEDLKLLPITHCRGRGYIYLKKNSSFNNAKHTGTETLFQ